MWCALLDSFSLICTSLSMMMMPRVAPPICLLISLFWSNSDTLLANQDSRRPWGTSLISIKDKMNLRMNEFRKYTTSYYNFFLQYWYPPMCPIFVVMHFWHEKLQTTFFLAINEGGDIPYSTTKTDFIITISLNSSTY